MAHLKKMLVGSVMSSQSTGEWLQIGQCQAAMSLLVCPPQEDLGALEVEEEEETPPKKAPKIPNQQSKQSTASSCASHVTSLLPPPPLVTTVYVRKQEETIYNALLLDSLTVHDLKLHVKHLKAVLS